MSILGLRDLDFGKSCFRAGFDDYVNFFINPVLSESVSYDRLAGYFSSSSFVVIAKGLSGLFRNNGKMRLVCGPKLTKSDIQALEEGTSKIDAIIESRLISEIESAKNEDLYILDHTKALAILVSAGLLEIKIAIVTGRSGEPLDYDAVDRLGIFHHKCGIITDKAGDSVSFSGSINETYYAWVKNDEGFKIFKSWEPKLAEYYQADVDNFNDHWSNSVPNVKVFDLPDAVKKSLVSIAPNEESEIEKVLRSVSANRQVKKLRSYQTEAVENWKKNNYRGIFEMATGTGKTLCALECIRQMGINHPNEKKIIVVACPKKALVDQWVNKDLPSYGYENSVVANSDYPGWEKELHKRLYSFGADPSPRTFVIVTTYDTLSSGALQTLIHKTNAIKMLVCDEVHHTSSGSWRKCLDDLFSMRLGLTAILEEDEPGEYGEVLDYFSGIVYAFNLERALTEINPEDGKTFLCPYNYDFEIVELTEAELEEYSRLTKSIARTISGKGDNVNNDALTALLNQRKRIIKQASLKFEVLRKIIQKIGSNLDHCIIYAPDKNENILRIQNCLNEFGIVQSRMTVEESQERRDELLEGLKDGTYKVIIAKKILDEGIDVPSINKAIFMASSSKTTEFVQRRGRILRRAQGKELAEIYDMVVVPGIKNKFDPLRQYELRIFESEIKRIEHFALLAENKLACLNRLEKIKKMLDTEL